MAVWCLEVLQKRAWQQWEKGQPKLEAARQLRKFPHVPPNDQALDDTIRNARRMSGGTSGTAVLCVAKTSSQSAKSQSENVAVTKFKRGGNPRLPSKRRS